MKMSAEENAFTCQICNSPYDDMEKQPKFLPCHHTFCKSCLKEYVGWMGIEFECPTCNKVATIPAAGVAAMQTNYYIRQMQDLVHGPERSSPGIDKCSRHPQERPAYYCQQCEIPICDSCCIGICSRDKNCCMKHLKIPLDTATEGSKETLVSAYSRTQSVVQSKVASLERIQKNFTKEKDDVLKRIDSSFDRYMKLLKQRASLLKRSVLENYQECTTVIETDLSEIERAVECIKHIKVSSEKRIAEGDLRGIKKRMEEIGEIGRNISEKIKIQKGQIVFDEGYKEDKFTDALECLGKVSFTAQMTVNVGLESLNPESEEEDATDGMEKEDKSKTRKINSGTDKLIKISDVLFITPPASPDASKDVAEVGSVKKPVKGIKYGSHSSLLSSPKSSRGSKSNLRKADNCKSKDYGSLDGRYSPASNWVESLRKW